MPRKASGEGSGGRIAAIRSARRMTQEDLALAAHISLSLLRKIEQGTRVASDPLGILDRHHEVLPLEFHTAREGVSMVPPVGAGVVGIQARQADAPVMRLLDELNHVPTARHILAERTMLHMLFGHCNSPIAGHASTTPDGKTALFGMVFNRDGSEFARSHAWGDHSDPATLGARVAADLLHQGARNLITATRK